VNLVITITVNLCSENFMFLFLFGNVFYSKSVHDPTLHPAKRALNFPPVLQRE